MPALKCQGRKGSNNRHSYLADPDCQTKPISTAGTQRGVAVSTCEQASQKAITRIALVRSFGFEIIFESQVFMRCLL